MEHQDENPDMTYVGMQDGESAQNSCFKHTVESENSNSEPVFKSHLKLWCKNKNICKI